MVNAPIAIIIVNWNGWADTRECLISLSKLTYSNFVIILVDNGSINDAGHIQCFAASNYQHFITYTKEEIGQLQYLPQVIPNSFILINNKENLGFAKANNIGIKYAHLAGFEYAYLLNNDTIVEANSLGYLADTLINSQHAAVVPQIRYFEPDDRIWCCGGNMKNFYEHYNFKDDGIDALPQNTALLNITFATGCALLFRISEVQHLTEQFFFGEEDFELALRLQKQKKTMACVLDAVIYHKESASINRSAKYLNKLYVHKLNRLVNIKTYAPLRWPFITVYRSFKFMLLMLLVQKASIRASFKYAFKLCYQAFTLNKVTKETFFCILNLDMA